MADRKLSALEKKQGAAAAVAARMAATIGSLDLSE
jgi:hypothetical protein